MHATDMFPPETAGIPSNKHCSFFVKNTTGKTNMSVISDSASYCICEKGKCQPFSQNSCTALYVALQSVPKYTHQKLSLRVKFEK